MHDWKNDALRIVKKSYEIEAVITLVLFGAVILGAVAYGLYLAWPR